MDHHGHHHIRSDGNLLIFLLVTENFNLGFVIPLCVNQWLIRLGDSKGELCHRP